tara:strand:+ start:2627 stop:2935 length:309 start_codon:yes stop_codon:yes gene_type:complete
MDTKFQQEIHSMEQRLTDMEEKMTSIDTKLTQVVDAILGNPLTKAGGFINDIEVMKSEIGDLKRRVIDNEEFRKRIGWTVGIIVVMALVAQYLINVYTNIKR